MVNNPYEGRAVDLNTLPTVAIERIEVLRDGASAIYGTDAIAGVINIITRKEFQGISVAADGKRPKGAGAIRTARTSSGVTARWQRMVGTSTADSATRNRRF